MHSCRAEEISPHCSFQNKKKLLLHKTRISPSLFRLDTSRTRSKMSAAEPSLQRATRSRSPRKSRDYTMPTPIPLVQTHFLPSPLSCTILQSPAPGTTLVALNQNSGYASVVVYQGNRTSRPSPCFDQNACASCRSARYCCICPAGRL